jgi:hypothetical protein
VKAYAVIEIFPTDSWEARRLACWTHAQQMCGLRLRQFAYSNGCSGEIRCAAKCVLLHIRGNAASAIAATAQGGFVRRAAVRAKRGECPVPAPCDEERERTRPAIQGKRSEGQL